MCIINPLFCLEPDVLDFFARMTEDHGPIYRIWMFNVPKICIADPDLAIVSFFK